MLAALRLGHPANRAARPDWTDAHWAYWASVQRVVVGGGLVSGRLGEIAVDAAAETVRAAGAPNLAVKRSPFGRWLPLLGLAASVPCEAGRALIFDFGQTAVKRGLATLAEDLVTALDLLPVLPSPCHLLSADDGPTGATARWAAMRDQIAATWREVSAGGALSIGICVASHMQAGHPLPTDRGCYGSLQQLAPHLETFMSDDLSTVLGRPLPVTLMHDGASAAAACAGSDRTAALVLGTAIGVGYTDGPFAARRLAGSLAVRAVPT